jgi:hypothetical protein
MLNIVLALDREDEIVMVCEIVHINYPAEDNLAGLPVLLRGLVQLSVIISGDFPEHFQ